MGEAESFIRFHCDNCGNKSTVSGDYAGKKIRCPVCNNIIFVPDGQSQSGAEQTNSTSEQSAYDLTLLDISEKETLTWQRGQMNAAEESHEQELKEPAQSEEAEYAGRRRLPWFIDIFFYPFSKSGLINLAIFILVPPFFELLQRVLPEQLKYVLWIVNFVVQVFVFLYLYWYIAECMRDSADGWTRAPQGFGGISAFSDVFGQTVNIMGCLFIFFGPFLLYVCLSRRADIFFWLLLIYAVLLFPMALLAVVIHDSAGGINPRLVISSIRKTFFPYLGLILIYIIPMAIISFVPLESIETPAGKLIFRSVVLYLALIGAHLLGRFYWRYKEKLDWEV